MLNSDQIIRLLNLQPHPIEGGYFVQTYKSEHRIPRAGLPEAYTGDRSLGTAIYYMLTQDTFSAMHRLPGDEIFHFYLGDPVEMLQLKPDGSGEIILLGQDIVAGMKLQHNVEREVWQGSRLADGGKFALLGTTMAPGFEFQDYETGNRQPLISAYPHFAGLIAQLTR